jgi:hypothetical protein
MTVLLDEVPEIQRLAARQRRLSIIVELVEQMVLASIKTLPASGAKSHIISGSTDIKRFKRGKAKDNTFEHQCQRSPERRRQL